MNLHSLRRPALIGGSAAVLAAAAALLSGPAAAEQPSGPETGRQEITLDDGSRVAMYYSSGDGLVETHRGPEGGEWSAPRVVVESASAPCQDIQLDQGEGTVAAIASFGDGCYVGETPSEAVAAVGTGDLTDWEHHVSGDGFGGWTDVAVETAGDSALFLELSESGRTELEWQRDTGFGEPDHPGGESPNGPRLPPTP